MQEARGSTLQCDLGLNHRFINTQLRKGNCQISHVSKQSGLNGYTDLSFLLPVVDVCLSQISEESEFPCNLSFEMLFESHDLTNSWLSLPEASQELGLVMHSHVLEDSSVHSPARGTCHFPFSDSWNNWVASVWLHHKWLIVSNLSNKAKTPLSYKFITNRIKWQQSMILEEQT